MFREVFPFRVVDAMKSGATVFCLDRKENTVEICNGMNVMQLFRVIDAADDGRTNRFCFWLNEPEKPQYFKAAETEGDNNA